MNCLRGSVRAERSKLLCVEEREGGKKKIILCGGAWGRKEGNYCVRGSVRVERRKLLCEGAWGRKEGNDCVCGGA